MNTASSNIKYNGQDVQEFGIKNGDSLNDVISKFLEGISGFMKTKIQSGSEEEPMDVHKAVQTISDKLSKLDIKDLGYSDMPVIPKSLSYEAINISALKIPGNYSFSGNNLVFSFDYSSLLSFGEISARSVVVANNLGRQEVLQETYSNAGSLNIPLDKIPGHIDIRIVVKGKNGDIILTKTESVYSPVAKNTFMVFDVKDFTANPENKRSVNEFLVSIDQRISELEVLKSFVNQYEISGLKNLGDQKGVFGAISNVASFSDYLKEEISSLNEVSLPGQTKKLTIQNVFDIFVDQYTALSKSVKDKDSKIQTLNTELNKLSGLYTNVLNNLSGGTSVKVNQSVGSGPGGLGGCIGGGCGGTIVVEGGTETINENMNNYIDPEELIDASLSKFIAIGLTLVDFYSDNCSPCTQMEPVMGYLNGYFNTEITKIRFGKINITSNSQSKQNHAIAGTPTFVIFKDGVEVDRVLGVNSFEFFRTKIESYL